jgi:hypothetical protein
VYTLEWYGNLPDREATPSEANLHLTFRPWSRSASQGALDTFNKYLDWKSRSTVIDVSSGFSNPRILEWSEDFRPHGRDTWADIPDGPPTYVCDRTMVATYVNQDAEEFTFCISKGVRFRRVDAMPIQIPSSDVQPWKCQIVGDEHSFSVNPVDLRQVDVEDKVPNDFVWCDRGIDAEFHEREAIPVSHIVLLGHGGSAVVDKVVCGGRVLARKQIKCTRRLSRTAALRELEATRKVQDHAHVVKIVGSYTQGNTLGILLHPAAECDLQTALERFSDPSSDYFTDRARYVAFKARFFEYFGCLAHGLAYMHDKGIRHRDIKPRNILVTFDGPLFTDFGELPNVFGAWKPRNQLI